MSLWESACLLSLAAVLGTAVVTDLRVRRIPNSVVLAGMALGFFFQTAGPEGYGLIDRWWGGVGALQGAYGMLAGFAIFLPFYMLRTLGAGDVKLLAMLGVWFGARPMIGVALLTFLCGGVLALGVALWSRSLGQALANIRFMLTDALVRVTATGRTVVPAPARTTGRLPYAIAITAGAVLEFLLLKGWY